MHFSSLTKNSNNELFLSMVLSAKKKPVLTFILSLIILSSQAQTTVDSVDIFIKNKMQSMQIPGLQLAAIRHGKIIKLKSYGLANIENDVPVTDESVFSINSMTKAFVGVAIMQLQEEGKLNINDAISLYIDSLPAQWQAITLKQILTNTSGLPNIIDSTEHVLGNGIEKLAWQKVKTLPMQFKPGEQFAYNQTGYVILGKIINKLSGEPFAKFIEDRQFKVVGMKQSCFGDSYDIIPHYAGQYTTLKNVDGTWVNNGKLGNTFIDFPGFFRTASGILSTAHEMAKWVIAVQDGMLLKQKESLKLLWTPAILSNGKTGGFNELTNGYALGWPTVTRAEHPAVTPVGGARSTLFVYSEDDLSIVVLTNLQGSNPEFFVDEIAGYYISDMKESNGFGLPPSVKKLRAELLKQGFDKALEVTNNLKKKDPNFQLSEDDINAWGYKLLSQKRNNEAIYIFKLNCSLYPNSANVYDSMGDAFEITGDRQNAIKNYRHSLQLNPGNTNAADYLKKYDNN